MAKFNKQEIVSGGRYLFLRQSELSSGHPHRMVVAQEDFIPGKKRLPVTFDDELSDQEEQKTRFIDPDSLLSFKDIIFYRTSPSVTDRDWSYIGITATVINGFCRTADISTVLLAAELTMTGSRLVSFLAKTYNERVMAYARMVQSSGLGLATRVTLLSDSFSNFKKEEMSITQAMKDWSYAFNNPDTYGGPTAQLEFANPGTPPWEMLVAAGIAQDMAGIVSPVITKLKGVVKEDGDDGAGDGLSVPLHAERDQSEDEDDPSTGEDALPDGAESMGDRGALPDSAGRHEDEAPVEVHGSAADSIPSTSDSPAGSLSTGQDEPGRGSDGSAISSPDATGGPDLNGSSDGVLDQAPAGVEAKATVEDMPLDKRIASYKAVGNAMEPFGNPDNPEIVIKPGYLRTQMQGLIEQETCFDIWMGYCGEIIEGADFFEKVRWAKIFSVWVRYTVASVGAELMAEEQEQQQEQPVREVRQLVQPVFGLAKPGPQLEDYYGGGTYTFYSSDYYVIYCTEDLNFKWQEGKLNSGMYSLHPTSFSTAQLARDFADEALMPEGYALISGRGTVHMNPASSPEQKASVMMAMEHIADSLEAEFTTLPGAIITSSGTLDTTDRSPTDPIKNEYERLTMETVSVGQRVHYLPKGVKGQAQPAVVVRKLDDHNTGSDRVDIHFEGAPEEEVRRVMVWSLLPRPALDNNQENNDSNDSNDSSIINDEEGAAVGKPLVEYTSEDWERLAEQERVREEQAKQAQQAAIELYNAQMPMPGLIPLEVTNPEVHIIPLDQLPPSNSEELLSPEPEFEFQVSVRKFGVMQPIILFKRGEGWKDRGHRYPFIVAAGRRRIKAARIAHFSEIKAVVYPEGWVSIEAVSMIENKQRSANLISLILDIHRLIAEGRKLEDIAHATGLSVKEISKYSNMIQGLHPDLLSAVYKREIPVPQGMRIASLREEQQDDLREILSRRHRVTGRDVSLQFEKQATAIKASLEAQHRAVEADQPVYRPASLAEPEGEGEGAVPWPYALREKLFEAQNLIPAAEVELESQIMELLQNVTSIIEYYAHEEEDGVEEGQQQPVREQPVVEGGQQQVDGGADSGPSVDSDAVDNGDRSAPGSVADMVVGDAHQEVDKDKDVEVDISTSPSGERDVIVEPPMPRASRSSSFFDRGPKDPSKWVGDQDIPTEKVLEEPGK